MKKKFLIILTIIILIIMIVFLVILALNIQVNNRLKNLYENSYNRACSDMDKVGKERYIASLSKEAGINMSQEEIKNLTKMMQPFFESGGCIGNYYYKAVEKVSFFETFEFLNYDGDFGRDEPLCPLGKYWDKDTKGSFICK